MKTMRKIAIAIALIAAASAAHAGVRASAVTRYPQLMVAYEESFVPLNDVGATTLSFKLASAGRKLLTYSTMCAAISSIGEYRATLDLDIYVNGVVVAPTGDEFNRFCSSTSSGNGGWTRVSITVPIQGRQGDNTIRISARGNQFAKALWLGSSALVVYD